MLEVQRAEISIEVFPAEELPQEGVGWAPVVVTGALALLLLVGGLKAKEK